MNGMDRIRAAIEDYQEENGHDYEQILISEEFYEKLHEESAQKGSDDSVKKVRSTIIDFPGLKVVSDVDYDFRLLPQSNLL